MKKLITTAACLLIASCASANQISQKRMDGCYSLAEAVTVIANQYKSGQSKMSIVREMENDKFAIKLTIAITDAIDRGAKVQDIADSVFATCVEDAIKSEGVEI